MQFINNADLDDRNELSCFVSTELPYTHNYLSDKPESNSNFDDHESETSNVASNSPKFDQISSNIYLIADKKSRRKEIKSQRCYCLDDLTDDSVCCDDERCVNKALQLECDPNKCGPNCQNQRFIRRQYAPMAIRPAGDKGHGLFATDHIAKGSFLIEYVGEVIDDNYLARRSHFYKSQGVVHHYFMALPNSMTIDATMKGNIARFVNHSCDPNAATEKWIADRELRVGFFAIKNIAIDEEITFDYQFERFSKDKQQCLCGSANCRGFLGGGDENEEESESEDLDWKTIRFVEEGNFKEEFKDAQLKKSSKRLKGLRRKQRKEECVLMRILDSGLKSDAATKECNRFLMSTNDYKKQSSIFEMILRILPTADYIGRAFVKFQGMHILRRCLDANCTDDQLKEEQRKLLILQLMEKLNVQYRTQVTEVIAKLDMIITGKPQEDKDSEEISSISSPSETTPKLDTLYTEVDPIMPVTDVNKLAKSCSADSVNSSPMQSTPTSGSNAALDDTREKVRSLAQMLITKWSALEDEYRIPRAAKAASAQQLSMKNRLNPIAQSLKRNWRENDYNKTYNQKRIKSTGDSLDCNTPSSLMEQIADEMVTPSKFDILNAMDPAELAEKAKRYHELTKSLIKQVYMPQAECGEYYDIRLGAQNYQIENFDYSKVPGKRLVVPLVQQPRPEHLSEPVQRGLLVFFKPHAALWWYSAQSQHLVTEATNEQLRAIAVAQATRQSLAPVYDLIAPRYKIDGISKCLSEVVLRPAQELERDVDELPKEDEDEDEETRAIAAQLNALSRRNEQKKRHASGASNMSVESNNSGRNTTQMVWHVLTTYTYAYLEKNWNTPYLYHWYRSDVADPVAADYNYHTQMKLAGPEADKYKEDDSDAQLQLKLLAEQQLEFLADEEASVALTDCKVEASMSTASLVSLDEPQASTSSQQEPEQQASLEKDENGVALPSEWRATIDPNTKKYYYYNTLTRAVQWDRPTFNDPPPPPPEKMPSPPVDSGLKGKQGKSTEKQRVDFKLRANRAIEKLFKDRQWYVGMSQAKVRTKDDYKKMVRWLIKTVIDKEQTHADEKARALVFNDDAKKKMLKFVVEYVKRKTVNSHFLEPPAYLPKTKKH